MTRLVAALACLLSLPTFMQAAELDPAHVAKDAKWVVHVDWEALSESDLADHFRKENPEKAEGARRWLKERYGIDAQDDFKGMTFYGKTYKPHTGVAIVLGSYDKEKVTSLLEKQPGVERTKWEGRALYTYSKGGAAGAKAEHHGHDEKHHKKTDKKHFEKSTGKDKYKKSDNKEPKHGETAGDSASSADTASHQLEEARDAHHAKRDADGQQSDKHHAADHGRHMHPKTFAVLLYDDETVLIASSADAVKSAADLLEGNGDSLEDSDSKLISDIPDGSIFYGAAVSLDEIGDHGRSFPLLEQLKEITWAFGERDDQVFDNVKVVARDEELAPHVQKLLEGFAAMGRVLFADAEKLNELYDATEFSTDGDTVTVSWEGDADDVWTALEEVKPTLEKWHKAHRQKR